MEMKNVPHYRVTQERFYSRRELVNEPENGFFEKILKCCGRSTKRSSRTGIKLKSIFNFRWLNIKPSRE